MSRPASRFFKGARLYALAFATAVILPLGADLALNGPAIQAADERPGVALRVEHPTAGVELTRPAHQVIEDPADRVAPPNAQQLDRLFAQDFQPAGPAQEAALAMRFLQGEQIWRVGEGGGVVGVRPVPGGGGEVHAARDLASYLDGQTQLFARSNNHQVALDAAQVNFAQHAALKSVFAETPRVPADVAAPAKPAPVRALGPGL